MSDSTARPVSEEARFLRENWNVEKLEHVDEWIAVKGAEVTDHDKSLSALLERTSQYSPLYAFVWFGDM